MAEKPKKIDPIKSQLSTQVSTDAVPEMSSLAASSRNAPPTSLLNSDLTMDARPAGRLPAQPRGGIPGSSGGGMPIQASGGNAVTCRAITESIKDSGKIVQPRSIDNGKAVARSEIESMSSEGSSQSDSGSFSISDSCSLQSLTFEDELAKYMDDMPPDIKIGYYDCLVLYCEGDRKLAKIFRDHLEFDITLRKHAPVRAVLYDCDELISLAESKLKHLEKAVDRCTYVFIYLTAEFVKDKWMELSSESCLMNAIYDVEKRWCVVPVYTEKRSECKFKIPMGLNSLKGINYYNDDEFYRNGVCRLITDRLPIRIEKEKEHRVKQKQWIEQKKRDDADQERRRRWAVLEAERQTQQHQQMLKERTSKEMNMLASSLSDSHLASIGNSVKGGDVNQQNACVAEYMRQLISQSVGLAPSKTCMSPTSTTSLTPGGCPQFDLGTSASNDVIKQNSFVAEYMRQLISQSVGLAPSKTCMSPTSTTSLTPGGRPQFDLGTPASNDVIGQAMRSNSVSADAGNATGCVQNTAGLQTDQVNTNYLLNNLPVEIQQLIRQVSLSNTVQNPNLHEPSTLQDFPQQQLSSKPVALATPQQNFRAGRDAGLPDRATFNQTMMGHQIFNNNNNCSSNIPDFNNLSLKSYNAEAGKSIASSVGPHSRHSSRNESSISTGSESNMTSECSYDGQASHVSSQIQAGNLPAVGNLLDSISTIQEDSSSMPPGEIHNQTESSCDDQGYTVRRGSSSSPPANEGRRGQADCNPSTAANNTVANSSEPTLKIVNYYFSLHDVGTVVVGNENRVQGARMHNEEDCSDDENDASPVRLVADGVTQTGRKQEIPDRDIEGEMVGQGRHTGTGLENLGSPQPTGEMGDLERRVRTEDRAGSPQAVCEMGSTPLGNMVDQDAALSSTGSSASLDRHTADVSAMVSVENAMTRMDITNSSSHQKPKELPVKPENTVKPSVAVQSMVRPVAKVAPQLAVREKKDSTNVKQVVSGTACGEDETFVKSVAGVSTNPTRPDNKEVQLLLQSALKPKMASSGHEIQLNNEANAVNESNADKIEQKQPDVLRFGANYSDPQQIFYSNQTTPIAPPVSGNLGIDDLSPSDLPQSNRNNDNSNINCQTEAVVLGDDALSMATSTMEDPAMESQGFDPQPLQEDSDLDFDCVDDTDDMPSAELTQESHSRSAKPNPKQLPKSAAGKKECVIS